MSEPYDCTEDVRKHKSAVGYWMQYFSEYLQERSKYHDNSKLQSPEKECFDEWTPKLKQLTFGSPEYQQALAAMGEGLKHHYAANWHHPEHYPNGVNDMTLVDLVEMVCDWVAMAIAHKGAVDLKHATERFHLSSQMAQIIWNTLREIDTVAVEHNLPIPYLAQEAYLLPVDAHEQAIEKRGYKRAFRQIRTALQTMRGDVKSKDQMLRLLDVIESIDEELK